MPTIKCLHLFAFDVDSTQRISGCRIQLSTSHPSSHRHCKGCKQHNNSLQFILLKLVHIKLRTISAPPSASCWSCCCCWSNSPAAPSSCSSCKGTASTGLKKGSTFSCSVSNLRHISDSFRIVSALASFLRSSCAAGQSKSDPCVCHAYYAWGLNASAPGTCDRHCAPQQAATSSNGLLKLDVLHAASSGANLRYGICWTVPAWLHCC